MGKDARETTRCSNITIFSWPNSNFRLEARNLCQEFIGIKFGASTRDSKRSRMSHLRK